MKSFWLNLLVTALVFQGTTVNVIGQPSPGSQSGVTNAAQTSDDILMYSDNNNSQTWVQGNIRSCVAHVKPDGTRLVKVYVNARVHCTNFADSECKTPDPNLPPQEVERGVRDIPAGGKGSARCELVQ